MNAGQRKAAQRQRDKAMGWAEITVRVDAARADEVRAFAASLPPPPPPTDPAQLSLIEQLDAALTAPGNGQSSFEL